MSKQQNVLIMGVDDNNQPRPIRVIGGRINTTTSGATAATEIQLVDENGDAYGIPQINGKPRISSQPYTYDIAEENISGHVPWYYEGYTENVTTSQFDLWGPGGTYVFPTAEMGMEVVSTDNTDDIGTVIHSGTMTGGSATTIEDTGADFTAGTPVVVGDHVLINKDSTAPEFGTITGVTATTLTIANGFSRGIGGAAGKTYDVLDYSATDGIQAVQVCYLDEDLARGCEIVVMNGTTVVATTKTDIYRINGFRAIVGGADGVASGTISLRHLADTPIYDTIQAGETFCRNSAYTVAEGYTLYITSVTFSFGYAANQTHYCRLFLQMQQFNQRDGRYFGDSLFYPYAETVVANNATQVSFDIPIKVSSGTDMKISGVSSTATGITSAVLRGWVEEND